MPTLDFQGKQYIYAHHLTVPYRPLEPDESLSCNSSGSDEDNLIIHGDNLEALKALLPRYANRVNCIYIDPPYNTGNEAWVYDDNVKSPLMQRWLSKNGPVENDDLERHDKWLCMMWPRLNLLKNLIAEDGVIFISIDDNEQHHLRMMMDEIFGAANFIACLPTVMNLKGNNDEFGFAGTHEYTLCWAKNREEVKIGEFALEDEELESWLIDDYGFYKKGANLKATGVNAPRAMRPNLYYPICVNERNELTRAEDSNCDDCDKILPITNGEEMSWRWSREKVYAESYNIIVERVDTGISLFKKQRPSLGDLPTKKPKSLFYKPEYSSGNGTAVLKQIFERKAFNNPKPLQLLEDLISLTTNEDAIILDSFSGSGTTAHAVLALNKKDGGNRKFILVECERYALDLTAERVRRVIEGVPEARNLELRAGLNGSFTYCTLGEPIEAERILTGESLPAYEKLAAYLLHTASGKECFESELQRKNDAGLFYSGATTDYYLLYEPDLEFLRSNEAMFNEELAVQIREAAVKMGKSATVFAAGKFMSQKDLTEFDITFCQLPYCLHYRQTP